MLVVSLTCDKPGRISFTAELNRPERFTTSAEGPDGLIMTGQMSDGRNGTTGIRYVAHLRAMADGGTTSTADGKLRIQGANAVTILLAAGTDYKLQPPDYRGNNPDQATTTQLARAGKESYTDLRDRHVADYQSLFRRVSLDLGGGPEANDAPTDERLKALRDGATDPRLITLYFQFGRYLLISSSRPGSLPANLQGIWAEGVQTPWNGDYHANINVQMNYWPAEICNLAECHYPLFASDRFPPAQRPQDREGALRRRRLDGAHDHERLRLHLAGRVAGLGPVPRRRCVGILQTRLISHYQPATEGLVFTAVTVHRYTDIYAVGIHLFGGRGEREFNGTKDDVTLNVFFARDGINQHNSSRFISQACLSNLFLYRSIGNGFWFTPLEIDHRRQTRLVNFIQREPQRL